MTTYYSRVQYTGDGTTNPKAVPFPFIQQSYVEVYINGVLKTAGTDYTWPSGSTIAPTVAWPNGSLVEFRRNTPKAASLVNFADGGTLDEAMLDLNTTQLLHVAQESIDAVGDNAQVYATQAAASAGTAVTAANAAATSATTAAGSATAAAASATAAAASAASINPATVAHNTSNETWAGIKTFTSSPVIPDAVGATQAASKGQMDTADAATLAAAEAYTDSHHVSDVLVSAQYITATGAFSVTTPAGATRALIKLQAGGGRGGPSNNSNSGGGGGYLEKLLTGLVGGTTVLTGSVGAGATTNVTAGGSTTLTAPVALTASGGAGTSTGGAASGGDWNVTGGSGASTYDGTSGYTHAGGNAPLGKASFDGSATLTPPPPQGYGYGGAGAQNGGNGIAIILFYK